MTPDAVLRRIALLLERAGEPSYRARAFRRAAATLGALPPEELRTRAEDGTLRDLAGLGEVTASIATEALAGVTPAYLVRLERELAEREPGPGGKLFAALRGDCH